MSGECPGGPNSKIQEGHVLDLHTRKLLYTIILEREVAYLLGEQENLRGKVLH